ncbi:PQQ-binding-like beta-propeller repeat protein [Pendulispora albinea]|uniref:PQQ-binding-like beta-propeller repeat protein n=1 Tax=Pendulispora albinea TaxID=2741071 RepID=A0ABZ2LXT9_9BACT
MILEGFALLRNARSWPAPLAVVLLSAACNDSANGGSREPPTSDEQSAVGLHGWPSGGHDIRNTRSNPAELRIGPHDAPSLAVTWTYATQGDVSATPAVVDGAVYFPDWGGFLHKVDARTGRAIWSRAISEYTGTPGAIARSSPAVSNGLVYIGQHHGGLLMAVSARTGDLVWRARLDEHPEASLTASPLVMGDTVFQPVSSQEAGAAEDPNYPCCTFRGSMTAVDAATGRVRWKTYTVPENGGARGGYSGGSIWGAPAIDPKQRRIYVTTGNNYTVPRAVKDCQLAGGSPKACQSPDNHVDSILALDMDSGAIAWKQGTEGFDDWTNACLPGFPPNNCPIHHGPDADLGTGAQLFTIPGARGPRLVVGAGQKNGTYWALDACTGRIVWSASVAPGGPLGGIMWGAATADQRIFIAATNFDGRPHSLPNGTTITSGSYAALDAATGRILWQIADPSGGMGMGAVSTANGVVYAGSTSGHMYAFDARTGAVLFDFLGEGTSNAGPAISNGTVYWGNGYTNIPLGLGPSRTFYAFSVIRP